MNQNANSVDPDQLAHTYQPYPIEYRVKSKKKEEV
jgi:hypothetical protein